MGTTKSVVRLSGVLLRPQSQARDPSPGDAVSPDSGCPGKRAQGDVWDQRRERDKGRGPQTATY